MGSLTCFKAYDIRGRLGEDIKKVCDDLGLSWEPDRLPSFKTGIRPKGIPIDQLYTDESRDIISTVHARKLADFHYSLPECV